MTTTRAAGSRKTGLLRRRAPEFAPHPIGWEVLTAHPLILP
eukprot:CAMPEP_0172084734 /NCGR_PEP_ID=MMETSP1043-20130122/21156_1 /TAXON_ID=464988 /ORGANISM="Hemiselmis andersenii, Strain CCMP441" /LENGTH=40 /DNA_ID= /DNA_START= /DNA_END= /DNA_ORIENTATION=